MKKIISTLVVVATVVLAPIGTSHERKTEIKYAQEIDNNVEVDVTNTLVDYEYKPVSQLLVQEEEVVEPIEVKGPQKPLQIKASEKELKVVEPKRTYYKVVPSSLNKRKTADLKHSSVGYLEKGQPVVGILTLSNGWVELSDGSFVNGKYLSVLDIATKEEFNEAVKHFEVEKAKRLEQIRKAKEERARKAREERERKARLAAQHKTAKLASNNSGSKSTGRNGITITRSERNLLARLVRAEAGGESYEGMVAVASVVFNRVASKQFPNDITSIIYARNQFEPVSNGSINRQASDIHYRAVDDALQRDNTNGALYFYAPSMVYSPYMESLRTVAVIGAHEFKVD